MDPLLQLVPPPLWHGVEVVTREAERELKVVGREVPLQVAPVDVRRQLVVGGEQDVQRVDLVLA